MIRDLIKRLPFATSAIRAVRNARIALPRRPRPAILMYHRIGDLSCDPFGVAVAPEFFDEQLAWLATNRTVLPLVEFAERQRVGDLPGRAVAVTFDDGYACTAEAAAPLLEKFGVPATVFIPAELIEQGKPFWWDELEALVFASDREELRVDGQCIRLGERRQEDRNWAPGAPPRSPRQSAYRRIWASLRAKTPDELDRSMNEVRAQVGPAALPASARLMTPQQVREAADGGLIAFGSHALTHPPLPQLGSQEKRRQIEESVNRCAALSGRVPQTFAYPYGDHDSESEKLVEQAGFACACTGHGRRVTASTGLYTLPRIAVGNWDDRHLGKVLGGS